MMDLILIDLIDLQPEKQKDEKKNCYEFIYYIFTIWQLKITIYN